jgi:ZIP family zinc transporter
MELRAMIEAAFWGFVGGFALLVGALIALNVSLRPRTVGLIMGFGSGVLISAVAYELVGEAFTAVEGQGVVALGLAAGAITFYAGDVYIERRGGGERKDADGDQTSSHAGAIVLGTILDGIPESIVIGISLLSGEGVSAAVVVAVFVSNLPESIAASTGLAKGGMPRGRILGLWAILALVCAAAAAIGYAVIGQLPPEIAAFVQAFAAGALLTMLGDTMIPEAYEAGGRLTGLMLVLGFALAFALTALERAA